MHHSIAIVIIVSQFYILIGFSLAVGRRFFLYFALRIHMAYAKCVVLSILWASVISVLIPVTSGLCFVHVSCVNVLFC